MCVFEKLKVKKTQAQKKLNVFSAPKLKLPEVFRPFFQNSLKQRGKTQEKISVQLKSSPRIQFSSKMTFCCKTSIPAGIGSKSEVFLIKTQLLSPKNQKLKQISQKTQRNWPKNSSYRSFNPPRPLEKRPQKSLF